MGGCVLLTLVLLYQVRSFMLEVFSCKFSKNMCDAELDLNSFNIRQWPLDRLEGFFLQWRSVSSCLFGEVYIPIVLHFVRVSVDTIPITVHPRHQVFPTLYCLSPYEIGAQLASSQTSCPTTSRPLLCHTQRVMPNIPQVTITGTKRLISCNGMVSVTSLKPLYVRIGNQHVSKRNWFSWYRSYILVCGLMRVQRDRVQ